MHFVLPRRGCLLMYILRKFSPLATTFFARIVPLVEVELPLLFVTLTLVLKLSALKVVSSLVAPSAFVVSALGSFAFIALLTTFLPSMLSSTCSSHLDPRQPSTP